jgi:hypothetical protein
MPRPPVARRRIAIAYMPYVPHYSIYSHTQAVVCYILAVLDSEEADSDAPSDESSDNENLCHRCHKEGVLLCCSKCRHSWHESCLPADVMPVDSDPWLCPVCTGSTQHAGFVGNPRQPAQRGSKERARNKRSRAEGTKAQIAEAKKARRQTGERYR